MLSLKILADVIFIGEDFKLRIRNRLNFHGTRFCARFSAAISRIIFHSNRLPRIEVF